MRDDGAVALGDSPGAGFETSLLAVGHAVKPCGMSKSRRIAWENAAAGRKGHNSLAGCMARVENFQGFRLGLAHAAGVDGGW